MRGSASSLLALGLVLAGLVWIGGPGSQPATAGDSDAQGGTAAFDRQVTGTWFTTQPSDSALFPDSKTVMNINSGGTLGWSISTEEGGLVPLFMSSAVYGTWRQTAPHEMRSVEVGFIYDATGSHAFTGRVAVRYTFAPDFQTFTAQFFEELFEPDQDPTDPDAQPVNSFQGSFTGTRFPPPS